MTGSPSKEKCPQCGSHETKLDVTVCDQESRTYFVEKLFYSCLSCGHLFTKSRTIKGK